MNKIRAFTKKTFDTIKNFRGNTLVSTAYLIPIIMILVSLIAAIIGYIQFIFNKGYNNQISLVKEFGFKGVSEGFTSGSSGLLISGYIPKIIWVMFLIQMIVMLITYFKNAKKVNTIIMIVDLVILLQMIVLYLGYLYYPRIVLAIFENIQIVTVLLFRDPTISFQVLFISLIGVAVASTVTFIVLVMKNKCRWMFVNGIFSLAVNFIILPLLVLLLENIIPLVVGIIFLVVFGGIFYVILKIFITGFDEETSTSSKVTRNSKEVKKELHQQVKKFEIETVFWRDKGGNGITIPQGDCIYFKNSRTNKDYVCSVYDFEKGNVAIIVKGKRIINIAGCKFPER